MEYSILLLSERTPISTLKHSTTMLIPLNGQMKNTDSYKYSRPVLLNNETTT